MTRGDLDLTRDLKELVQLAASDETIEELLERGLDWMGRVAPYELATVFELRGDRLVVRAARGPLARADLLGHEIDLEGRPALGEVLRSRRARAFSEHDHNEHGDAFDGVLDFPPGHSCMVVPLCVGDGCYGVATLDRSVCEAYPASTVELVEVYGHVLAIAIRYADQKLTLQRLHSRELDRIKLLEESFDGSMRLLVGSKDPQMQLLVRNMRQVARATTPVLILGETGTGKERLARALHQLSPRAEQPFVALNCAAIPPGLLESELFGHVKGAFTGAARDRAGRFQLANGGTLLLDEIGELPLELQSKLLRVVQEARFEPVGSDRTVRVDVRILAATHVDLVRAIDERRFREDLYYRLAVFPLRLPPLRERMVDLELACVVLLDEIARRTGRRGMRVTKDGLAKLASHEWRGNLRELANVLERGSILSPTAELGPEVLEVAEPRNGEPTPKAVSRPVMTLREVEREHVRRVLAQTRGKIYGADGAAALLGLKPSTLQSRMRKLGLERRVVVTEGAEPAAGVG